MPLFYTIQSILKLVVFHLVKKFNNNILYFRKIFVFNVKYCIKNGFTFNSILIVLKIQSKIKCIYHKITFNYYIFTIKKIILHKYY